MLQAWPGSVVYLRGSSKAYEAVADSLIDAVESRLLQRANLSNLTFLDAGGAR